VAIAVLVALAVAAGALSLGHRSQPSRSAAAPIPGTARLLNRLAVLRRPQTAADRSLRASQVRNFEVQNFNGGDGQQLVGSLTRLAQTVQTPRGTTRIYLIVETPVPGHDRIPPGVGPRLGDQVSVLFTGAGGSGAGGTQPAGNLTDPRDVGLNGVVNEGIVPDGVTRVRWVYRGLGQYLRDRVTIVPTVRNNIAASRVVRSQGLLVTATWYGRNGRVIAYYNTATSAARSDPER
jgi:hypothetical protein